MQYYSPETPGKPRDRRKLRLQADIRREAFKLFAKNGYAQTSIEDIAAAADISYSTFFRHFATKDALAIDLRFDAAFAATLGTQPQDISLRQAIHHATTSLPTLLTKTDLTEVRENYLLTMRIPELRSKAFTSLNGASGDIAEIVASRLGRSSDAIDIQAFAWSIVGAWIAAFHYWITHKDSELLPVFEEAMQGVSLEADRIALTKRRV